MSLKRPLPEYNPKQDGNIFEWVLRLALEKREATPEWIPLYVRNKVEDPGRRL